MLMLVNAVLLALYINLRPTYGGFGGFGFCGRADTGKEHHGMFGVPCCDGNCCTSPIADGAEWLSGPFREWIWGDEMLKPNIFATSDCWERRIQHQWVDRETALPPLVFKLNSTFKETDPGEDASWVVDVTTKAPKTASMGINIAKVVFSSMTSVLGPQVKAVVGTALAIAPMIDSAITPKPKMSVDLSNTIEKLRNILDLEDKQKDLKTQLMNVISELDNIRSFKAGLDGDSIFQIREKTQTFAQNMGDTYNKAFKLEYISPSTGEQAAAYFMFENMMALFAARYEMEQLAFVSKLAMIPTASPTRVNSARSKGDWRKDACNDLRGYLYGNGNLGATDTASFPYQWNLFKTYFNTAKSARLRAVNTHQVDEKFRTADVTCYHDHSGSMSDRSFSAGIKFVDNWPWDGEITEYKWGWEARAKYDKDWWGNIDCSLEYFGHQIVDEDTTREWMEARWTDYEWQIRKKFRELEGKYDDMKRAMETAMESQLLVCDMALEEDTSQFFAHNAASRDLFCMKIDKPLESNDALVNLFDLEKITHQKMPEDCRLMHDTMFVPDLNNKFEKITPAKHMWECKVRCQRDVKCNRWSFERAVKKCHLFHLETENITASPLSLEIHNFGVKKDGWVSGYGIQDRCDSFGAITHKPRSSFTPLPEGYACGVSVQDSLRFMWFFGIATQPFNYPGYTTEVDELASMCEAGDRDGVRRKCEELCDRDDQCNGYSVYSDWGMDNDGGDDGCICFTFNKDSSQSTHQRGYECTERSQGESGKSFKPSSDNSLWACEQRCDRDSGCEGFDFTTKVKGDSCRLFTRNIHPRIGVPGVDNRMWCKKLPAKPTCGEHWGFDQKSSSSKSYQGYIKDPEIAYCRESDGTPFHNQCITDKVAEDPTQNICGRCKCSGCPLVLPGTSNVVKKAGRAYTPMPTGMVCPRKQEYGYWDQRNKLYEAEGGDPNKVWMPYTNERDAKFHRQCQLHNPTARQAIYKECQRMCNENIIRLPTGQRRERDCVGFSVSSDEHWESGGCLCVLYASEDSLETASEGVDHCPVHSEAATGRALLPNYLTFKKDKYTVQSTITDIDVQVLGGTEDNLAPRNTGVMSLEADAMILELKRAAPVSDSKPWEVRFQGGSGIATFSQTFQSDDLYICPKGIEVDSALAALFKEAELDVRRRTPMELEFASPLIRRLSINDNELTVDAASFDKSGPAAAPVAS